MEEKFLPPGAPAEIVIAGRIEDSAGTNFTEAFEHGDLPGITTVLIDGKIVDRGRSGQTPPPANLTEVEVSGNYPAGGCTFCCRGGVSTLPDHTRRLVSPAQQNQDVNARRPRERRVEGVAMIAPVEVGGGGVELLVSNGVPTGCLAYAIFQPQSRLFDYLCCILNKLWRRG